MFKGGVSDYKYNTATETIILLQYNVHTDTNIEGIKKNITGIGQCETHTTFYP